MKSKYESSLPKTAEEIPNGGVYLQRVRCGKSACRCARGELHEAFYLFRRFSGRLTKIYVPRSEVVRIRLLAERARDARRRRRASIRYSISALREARARLREFDRQVNVEETDAR